jgi:hypothetical protein
MVKHFQLLITEDILIDIPDRMGRQFYPCLWLQTFNGKTRAFGIHGVKTDFITG